MNSRGKPLTSFENFKAKFEQFLENLKLSTSRTFQLTFKEAKAALRNAEKETAQIAEVYPVSSNVVAVVLDSYFEKFDLSDIDLVVAVNEWKAL